MNSVQTILANTESKGSTLQDVNRALGELNTYADKTIYNFTEMTRNIGTFTAAGVDLDTSVNAIQGIANLAAVSGSNSQQASTAMYQLSQALSSGTVKLMDWNSVVNAGMGGQVFQDALRQTSKELKTGAEEAIKAKGSFRESLQTGWLTADVLTETLKKFTESGATEYVSKYTGLSTDAISAALESAEAQYGEADAINRASEALAKKSGKNAKEIADMLNFAKSATDAATKVKTFTQLWDTLKESAQSGWTKSWEIIVGDFGEAKELFTEVSDRIGGMIGQSADARNALLSGGLSSGWKQLLNAGIADEEGYKEAIESVAKKNGVAFDKMIKDEGSFDKALKKGLTEGTINADTLSKAVGNMAKKMKGMSAEERKAAGYTADHVDQIVKLNKGLKDGSISMDEFVKKISRTSGRENVVQALWNAFEGVLSVVEPIKQAFREIFEPLTGEQLYSFTEALVKFTEKLTISGETADKLKRTFKGVFALLDIGAQFIKTLFGAFADLVGYVAPAGSGILSFTANVGDFLVKVDEAIKSSNLFGKAIEKIKSF
jgi:tape measure domain-containing protein